MAMGAALIALRGAINWRGNGRGLREEAVAGALDALDAALRREAREAGETAGGAPGCDAGERNRRWEEELTGRPHLSSSKRK
jgi:hypothetical protein